MNDSPAIGLRLLYPIPNKIATCKGYSDRAGAKRYGRAAKPPDHAPFPRFPPPHTAEQLGEGLEGGAKAKELSLCKGYSEKDTGRAQIWGDHCDNGESEPRAR